MTGHGPSLLTASQIRAAMESRGLSPSRDFGQNFLIDHNLLRCVAAEGELTRRDCVLEVGVGNANLTRLLAAKAGCVVGVEIDRGLYGWAREELGGADNVDLLHSDALEHGAVHPRVLSVLDRYSEKFPVLKIISNLPYAICTPFILSALCLPFERMVLLLPRDIGGRMAADPGKKEYGVLSVALGVCARVTNVKKVPKGAFWPAPKIESMIVRIDPLKNPLVCAGDMAAFVAFVRPLMNYRRKSLSNVLRLSGARGMDRAFATAGIEVSRRAETLSPAEWTKVFDRARDSISLANRELKQ